MGDNQLWREIPPLVLDCLSLSDLSQSISSVHIAAVKLKSGAMRKKLNVTTAEQPLQEESNPA